MNEIETGGPAFPHGAVEGPDAEGCFYGGHPGMTLRDHFAGLALGRLIDLSSPDGNEDASATAEWAYVYADAMLLARNAKK